MPRRVSRRGVPPGRGEPARSAGTRRNGAPGRRGRISRARSRSPPTSRAGSRSRPRCGRSPSSSARSSWPATSTTSRSGTQRPSRSATRRARPPSSAVKASMTSCERELQEQRSGIENPDGARVPGPSPAPRTARLLAPTPPAISRCRLGETIPGGACRPGGWRRGRRQVRFRRNGSRRRMWRRSSRISR